MADIMAQADMSGNYVSIVKVIVFLLCFGLWAWVGQWLDKDAPYARANRDLWNNIYFWSGTAGGLLWFILPAPFLVTWLFFMVAWLTASGAYVFHRNARVSPDERILTPDHIKALVSREGRVTQAHERLVFISANRNELPPPHRQDPAFDSYVLSEDLVYDVWYRRVSRAEMIPVSDESQLRYVIDGVMGIGGERTRQESEQIVSYLKEVGDLDVKDRRKPQSGQFWTRIEGSEICWKLKTAGSTRGEQLLLERVEKAETLALDALGFTSDQLEKIEALAQEPSGVVLVSGPRGSGVTSTLYSIIRSHDAFIQNIRTLEQDMMSDLDNITQCQVDATNLEKNSVKQLQTVLRSDPDTAMIGFFDHPDMAKHITKFSSEGKRVYVGMAGTNTFECLQQWLQSVGHPGRVSTTLKALTNQRLVRKLCPTCKQAYVPDATLLKRLNLPAEKIKKFYRPPKEDELEYDKKGHVIPCTKCQGTGYFGRVAIFETLFITDTICELLRDNAPVNTIRAQSRKDKMRYLQEQALRKVIDGTTSIQEVLRVTAAGSPQKRPASPQRPGQPPASSSANKNES